VGPHAFWFDDPKHRADEFYFGSPKTFTAIDTEAFRGVDCHVIDSPIAWRRLFIGIADGRVHGISKRARPQSSDGSRILGFVLQCVFRGQKVPANEIFLKSSASCRRSH